MAAGVLVGLLLLSGAAFALCERLLVGSTWVRCAAMGAAGGTTAAAVAYLAGRVAPIVF